MTGRTRGAVVLAVAALALGAIGTATGITRKGGGGRRSGGNVARFATLTFGPEAFRRWDADCGDWTIDAGAYDLHLAASAADIRATVRIVVVS